MGREMRKIESSLDESWKLLMLMSANLAKGRYGVVSNLLEDAHDTRIPAQQAYEVILQCYLFLGYPRSIEGLKLLEQHYPEFTPPNAEELSQATSDEWKTRGERLCRTIYGDNYEALRRRIKSLSPDLDQWMVWEGYGKVLSRDGVPSALRELCTCSALVVTGDFVQLHSHMIGAIHVGASPEMLAEMIDLLDGTATVSCRRRSTKLLQKISKKGNRSA